ncbi:acetyl-CoA hydrolase/transferase family protein [Aminipila butyrica]|uniref:Acetyl-CoA hydrolase/transferase family protein n=2 Tax=Aminipila butyrica TaxID=433296 RepID=A0A858BYP2_9FIRM|nr:acetyl-CoA hydrolase/transferase family protein [Aminipila butyrica]QIB70707.1 acetyl-CoA hydrolase/transferase family protein [Aminipila butyrica]
MDWKELYESRTCTAEEAVQKIKSHDRVVLAHSVSEPYELVDAMVANAENYENVTVSQMVSLGKGEYTKAKYKGNFRYEGWFTSACTRECLAEGHGQFVPVYFHDVPRYIRTGIFPVDVAMVTLSTPDRNGFCSIGASCDFTWQAIKSAKVVLAEINDQAPVIYGETFVHVSEVDAFVETSRPLPELKLPEICEVEKAIGKNCASLIEDGATLQLGIGAIPDAVLSQLKDKKHLGIHSEMISDGVVDLYEAGVIDNSQKSIDKGKITVTFLMGTKKLYDFADRNPALEMKPVDYVNDPVVISQCSKMVCINSCLQVDFLGQVVSDTIGTRQFSGVGGQVDFVRGAAMSLDEQGKAIIAMPSIVKKKDGSMMSKIVPFIEKGAVVTTNRHDVDYIVTEYGIARMKGQTMQDRARALIGIAHPEFREELKEEFEKRFNTTF